MDSTRAQRKLIGHLSGNQQLIACAGSGKTEVVARRVKQTLRPGRQEFLPEAFSAYRSPFVALPRWMMSGFPGFVCLRENHGV